MKILQLIGLIEEEDSSLHMMVKLNGIGPAFQCACDFASCVLHWPYRRNVQYVNVIRQT